VVPEHKVVLDLDHMLLLLIIVLPDHQQQLRLHCRLVVILFLVLDELHGHQLSFLVVEAFEDLPESSLPDELQDLEPEPNLVSADYFVVALTVVKAIVDEPLGLSGVDLAVLVGQVVDLLELSHLLFLHRAQVLLLVLGLGLLGGDGEDHLLVPGLALQPHFLDCELLPFWSLFNDVVGLQLRGNLGGCLDPQILLLLALIVYPVLHVE